MPISIFSLDCRDTWAEFIDTHFQERPFISRKRPVPGGMLPWVAADVLLPGSADIDCLHRYSPRWRGRQIGGGSNRTWPDGTYWSSGWGAGMDRHAPREPNTTRSLIARAYGSGTYTTSRCGRDESAAKYEFRIECWQEIEDMEDEMKAGRALTVKRTSGDEGPAFRARCYGRAEFLTTKQRRIWGFSECDALDKERLHRMAAHLSIRAI